MVGHNFEDAPIAQAQDQTDIRRIGHAKRGDIDTTQVPYRILGSGISVFDLRSVGSPPLPRASYRNVPVVPDEHENRIIRLNRPHA